MTTGSANTPHDITPILDPSWSHVHLPRPDHPIEADLHASTSRGRDAALALIETVIPGLPLDELAQTTDGATFHASKGSPAVAGLFDARAALDQLFTWRSLRGSQLTLVREGEYIQEDALLAPLGPSGRPRVQTSRLAALMDRGYTVVLNGIDLRDEWSMRLTEAFERVFGCAVNINGYLSLRPSMSFGAHWDDQEVVILQLLGQKSWLVEEPTALSMAKTVHGSQTSERPVWEGVLDPGSALYVPRGWGHRVRSTEGLTYHYTITIPRSNGVGLLRNVMGQRTTWAGAARSVPLVADPHLFRELVDPPSEAELETAVALTRVQMLSRSTQRFSDSVTALEGDPSGLWVRCALAGGWVVHEHTSSHIVVAAAGRQFAIKAGVLPMVATWTDGLARRWPEAGSGADAVVRRLVELGLLDVLRDPPSWGHPRAV